MKAPDSIDIKSALQDLLQRGLGAPIAVMMLLGMVVLPLPPFLLDIFFTFNIALSLIILMVAIYADRPMDFAVFPTIILVATLFRLALNVASTRVVLLEGHNGPDAAGQVIASFGEFVIGGNYTVGLIVFIILVIINFAVVTKGAGRISEVSARFTLDAMPGKQMAIDADLNAGLIDQEAARLRRAEVGKEADFYGSMDGASKFVRGDAVAGIMITVINILGGLIVGMMQHDMGAGDAARTYVLLTIGDGLVAQIPSLVLSTAAGLIVTRANDEGGGGMSKQITGQLLGKPIVLGITAGLMGLIGLIPGMPNIPFLLAGLITGGGAYWLHKQAEEASETGGGRSPPSGATATAGGGGIAVPSGQEALPPAPEVKELSWDDVPMVDPVGLEVGYRLISMVDKNQGGELMSRIKGVHKKVSQELGFLVPPVHIRDNLDLSPNHYRLSLMGVTVGEAEIFPDSEMAINPGQVYGELQGRKTTDPAFGLEAIWIEKGSRDQAQSLGYTVVDPETVIATHLSQQLQSRAHELIGHEEVQMLLEQLGKSAPKLVEDLVPKLLPLGTVVKVVQKLLEEGIPVRDMRTIAESLADSASKSQDAIFLTAQVRVALGRMIVQKINGLNSDLEVITLDPNLEQLLHQSMQGGDGQSAALEPQMAERLHKGLSESSQRQEAVGRPAVLLTAPQLREMLSRFVRHSIPGLTVLSYSEIPDDKQLKIVATVGNS